MAPCRYRGCWYVQKQQFSVLRICAFPNVFNNLESLASSTNATENTAESDVIQYNCSVAFNGSGKISPSIRWTPGGTDVADGVVTTPSSNRLDSVYSVTAGTSNIPPCSCDVYFPQASVSGDDAAQNIPTYNDSNGFEEIVVTCKLFLPVMVAVFTASAIYKLLQKPFQSEWISMRLKILIHGNL